MTGFLLISGILAGGWLLLGVIRLWRETMQRSLQQSEERLRLALDATHIGVWEADLRTGQQIWSPQSEAIWGFAPGTFDGKMESFLSRIHPEDRDYVQQAHQDALRTGQYQVEYRIVLPDQAIRWLSNRAQVFYDAAGQPTRMIGIDLDVTDRKQAEAALRQSEESYRQLAEEMPVLICKFLPDSTLTYVNPAYGQYFNQSPEDLLGCRFLDFLPTQAERQRVQADYMAVTPDAPSASHEHLVTRPDGSQGWHEWVNQAFFDEQGQITSFQAIGFDITDRKRTEIQLQEQQARLNLALDAAHMGIWEGNLVTGEEILSPQAEALLGFAPGAFDGKRETFLSRVHPDDLEQVQESGKAALQSGILRDEYRIVLPDQTIRWIDCLGRVFYDEAGRPLRIVGVDLDITERKQIEEDLRQSELRFRNMAANVPGAIFRYVLHPDGSDRVVYMSPGCLDLWEVEAEVVVEDARVLWDVIDPEDQPAMYESVLHSARTLEPWSWQWRITTPSGKRKWLEASGRPQRYANGDIVWDTLITDVSDRKQLEIALQENLDRFQHLNNNVPAIVYRYVLAADGRDGFTYLSENAQEIYELPLDVCLNQISAVWERIHPDDLPRLRATILESAQSLQPWHQQYRFTVPSGRQKWLEAKSSPIRHPHGDVVWDGVIVDITDRKRAEVELRQQKEIFQTIFDHLPVMVGLYAANGDILMINRELEQVIGWPKEDYATVDVLRDCYPNPADYDQVLTHIITADSTWQDFQTRVRDGRILDTSWAQIRLSDGRSIGIGQDITERKQAERALRESETRFRQLAENIQEVFWMADVEFSQILYVSPAYEVIWGRTCASLYENPMSFADAIHPEDRDRVLAMIQQQRHQGWELEYRIIRPDGTGRWIWEQAFPVSNSSGQTERIVGICQDISDRKATEAALAESQKQYQNLAENSPDLIERLDLELRHLYVSPTLTGLTGIPATEFLGKTCRDLGMDETMVNIWEAAAARLLATKQKQVIEFETPTLNGIRAFEMAIVPELSDQQTIESILCISRDISDRKAAKAALEQRLQREQALNRVFQAIRQSLDLDTIFATATAEMSQLLQTLNCCVVQYLPEQKIWKTVAEFRFDQSHPSFIGLEVPDPGNPFADQLKRLEIVRVEATDRLECQINQAVAQTSPGAWLLIPLLVGDRIWGSFTLNTAQQPFTWTEEQVELAQAVANQLEVAIQQAELYQQVQQEQQNLLKSQTALIQAQQIAQVGSWELDAMTQAMTWSDTLFQIFGFDPTAPEPDFADVMMNYVHPDDRPRLEQALIQAMTEGRSYEIELRFFRTDGSMGYMEARAEAIYNEQGQVVRVVGTSVDISDRKQAELAIRELNEALEQQNQNLEVLVEQRTAELVQRTVQLEASNKELESFSYSVSHDLRAPLRHVHGFVNALRQQLQTHPAQADPKVTHYLQVIETSSQKMALLIDGLLRLSRLGRKPMAYAPVSLQDLVQEAIALVNSSSERTNPVEFVLSELPMVQGDATLLQQVFSNLIDNAVKFSRHHPAPRIDIGSLPDGTIFVKDNGIGFQMEYADKLFGAFQRLHSQAAFEGTGIGLAIVQRIIHRHGGTIWAESQPNQGATFYFTLSGHASK